MSLLRYMCVLLLFLNGAAVADTESYATALIEHVLKFRRYPIAASAVHASGKAVVRFTLDRGGSVLRQELVTSAGDADLDQEALAMLQRAQPFPRLPDSIAGNEQSFTLPILFASRQAKPLYDDVEVTAYLPGRCRTMTIAGPNLACKYVVYTRTKPGRAYFTVVLDDPNDPRHVLTFSGTEGRKPGYDQYELSIDRILHYSKAQPPIDGVPSPVVEPSSGICKQVGDFSARKLASLSCSTANPAGRSFTLEFVSDGTPIKVKSARDDQLPALH
jgi:TonB family protein